VSYNGNIKATWSKTMEELGDTFAKWDVVEWDVRPMRELDHRAHWQGDPASVTVRFVLRGDHINLECSAQEYYFENLRILWFAIEAMRMNEVRGLTTIIRDAYAQLAAPKTARDPHVILGVRPDAGGSRSPRERFRKASAPVG
jgi:hypothetical protein